MLATRTVTASGHGRTSVPRSTAEVRVGATHHADTLALALQGAESARAAVVEVALRHVEPTAVSSQGLNVWPSHDRDGVASGYDARHTLLVRCAALDVAGALVQALADEVGDRLAVDGVTLAAAPTADDVRTARDRAFADARATAEQLAALAGGALGAVLSVSEGASGAAPVAVALMAKADVGFVPGEDDVTVSLTVTWELG